jgi:acetyl esterase
MYMDPELEPFRAMFATPDYTDLAAARAITQVEIDVNALAAGGVQAVRVDINSPEQSGVPVWVMSPLGDSKAPRPVLIYVHGGGFVMGSVGLEQSAVTGFVHGLGAVVVAPEYRLAPESPYPAAVDDLRAVLGWLANGGLGDDVDTTRIALVGESAGATLACSLAIVNRDSARVPIALVCLGIPALDSRCQTESMVRLGDATFITPAAMRLGWSAYLGGQPAVGVASPSSVDDLTGLPPMFVSVASYDPLVDEALEFVRRLNLAGNAVELHLYPGTFHGAALAPTAVSRRIQSDKTAALARSLGLAA